MYAVVQEIDGILCIIGKYHRIYTDLEEAKEDYLSHLFILQNL